MLFLCQVSFQLQFSPPSSGAGLRPPPAPRSRGHAAGCIGTLDALCPQSWAAAFPTTTPPPFRALPTPRLRSPWGRKAAAWGVSAGSGIRSQSAPTSPPPPRWGVRQRRQEEGVEPLSREGPAEAEAARGWDEAARGEGGGQS